MIGSQNLRNLATPVIVSLACDTAGPQAHAISRLKLQHGIYTVNGSARNRRLRSPRSRRSPGRKRSARPRPEAVDRSGREGRPCFRSRSTRRVGHALQLQVSTQTDRRAPRAVSVDRRYLPTGLQSLPSSAQPSRRHVRLLRTVAPSRPQTRVGRPEGRSLEGPSKGRTTIVRQPLDAEGTERERLPCRRTQVESPAGISLDQVQSNTVKPASSSTTRAVGLYSHFPKLATFQWSTTARSPTTVRSRRSS
jgi:hypothetical protein